MPPGDVIAAIDYPIRSTRHLDTVPEVYSAHSPQPLAATHRDCHRGRAHGRMIGANPAAAVADGTPAVPGQYPFAVKLTMTHIPRPDGTYYDSACSAALISPTWIITAGHCFHDVNRIPVSGPFPTPPPRP